MPGEQGVQEDGDAAPGKRPTVMPARASYGTLWHYPHKCGYPDVGEADRENPGAWSQTAGVDGADAGGLDKGVKGGKWYKWPTAFFAEHGLFSLRAPMPKPASPLAGKTINRSAGCGRSARPVRREGGRNQSPLPTPIICFSLKEVVHQ